MDGIVWTEVPNDEVKLLRKGTWKSENSPAVVEFYVYDGVDRKNSIKVEYKVSMMVDRGFKVISDVTEDNYSDKIKEVKMLCESVLNELIQQKE